MTQVQAARHLMRAKDLADARYAELITVDDLAAATGLSRAHFSRDPSGNSVRLTQLAS